MQTKFILGLLGACLAVSNTKADDAVLGANFAVSHPTEISAFGVFDGGTALTSDETVGIFDASTGNLIGPEVLFGPDATLAGTQIGNILYESVPLFTLGVGDYSIVELTSGGAGSLGISGGGSYQNLGNTVNLPGGGRFNSGTDFQISPSESGGSQPLGVVDPVPDGSPVPDGGLTVALLGGALAGLGWIRRKVK